MNPYKTKLEAFLQDLTKELSAVGIHNPENPADWVAIPEAVDANEPDDNVAADAVEEWDERQALVATLERQYNNITRALGKIEANSFGTCEICNSAIEDDRLEVSPAARTCKAHMDEEEALPQ